MTTIDRRNFLHRSAAAGVGASGLTALMANTAQAKKAGRGNTPVEAPDNGGYGELQRDPAGVLALPAGFSYVRFGETGKIMSDGIPTPSAHDGMAAFPGPGSQVRLVRNHEENAGPPFTKPAYDPAAGGGTTNLVYDTARKELVRDNASLSGTVRNCAGGPTPWASWLTCEENTSDREEPHGYIFEVPADARSAVDPVPLKEMGRFVHEACAVDPATGIVYETEDRGTSGFYRFLPDERGNLAAGGRLQMLGIKGRGRNGYDTRTDQRVGKPLPVTWVDIEEPNPADAGANPLAVFNQGKAGGGATFDRLEGCWYGDGSVFFNSTSGGDAGLGQVWEYRPRGSSGGQLILVFESEDPDVLQSPDNITVSPRGGLLLCEDGGGTDFLRGVNPEGQIFDFARNDLNNAELAGATYSPDGDTLFVNIQSPGITFAITGPFEKGVL
jgi:secreted PhoX family phosphatase